MSWQAFCWRCWAIFLLATPVHAELKAGDEFRDCETCPVMVVIPAGEFTMGSPESEAGRLAHEGPQHPVKFANAFAVGKYEVTFAEWQACINSGGCNVFPTDDGWGRGNRPVINIDTDEMAAYLHWLTEQTGHIYRLLSEAEWEYAARAGSTSAYPWGEKANHDFANFGGAVCCSPATGRADKWGAQTAPVGSFPPNAFGLHDMHGNVYERVRDCWNPGYREAPRDGSAWLQGDCRAQGLRGGSWISPPELIRSAERDAFNGYYKVNVVGFRVARDIFF